MKKIILLTAIFLLCTAGSCDDSDDPGANVGETLLLSNVANQIQYCNEPDAIRLSDTGRCIHNKLNEGLIFNHDTGEKIVTDTIQAGIRLECRKKNSDDPKDAWANRWYKSSIEPSSGSPVDFVYSHTCVYNNKECIGVVPFDSYATGNILFCYTLGSYSNDYQRVKIN